jgi:hypothetical protein
MSTWPTSMNKYYEPPRKSLLNLLKTAGFLPAASTKPSIYRTVEKTAKGSVKITKEEGEPDPEQKGRKKGS